MIKRIIYATLAICMFSCSAPGGKYEKVIADAVQTDNSGTKHDLDFKVIELEELNPVTAKDSIAFFTDEFRKDQQAYIDRLELAKEKTKQLFDMEQSRRTPKQSTIDKYNADIARIDHRIDSLKNVTPDDLKGYDKMNTSEVLALVVRCKYAVDHPLSNRRIEETYDFYLSPDGSKVISKKKVVE